MTANRHLDRVDLQRLVEILARIRCVRVRCLDGRRLRRASLARVPVDCSRTERQQQGREQNLQGQGQEAKGQLSDLGQGISDRVQGSLGGAVAGLTGDRESQAKYADKHDEGKTRQRGVELDLDKQAKAQEK